MGGGSGADATWGVGKFWGDGGVKATGAGSASAVIGALIVVALDTLVASLEVTPSVDGNRGLKRVDA